MERIGECADGPSLPGLELEQGLHVTGRHSELLARHDHGVARAGALQKKEKRSRHTSAASVALLAGRSPCHTRRVRQGPG